MAHPIAEDAPLRTAEPRVSFLNDPVKRGLLVQFVLLVLVVGFFAWIVTNTAENLQRANIASGFGFLDYRAGFDIAQSVVPYSQDASYGYALLVGFINTLVVAVLGVVIASFIGLLVGIGRLSSNWLVRQISTAYVETFRNIPPLLVIFFWYFGVLAVLPQPRDALSLGFGFSLSNRGMFTPRPLFEPAFWVVVAGFAVGIAMTVAFSAWARRKQMRTGQQTRVLPAALALIVGLPLVLFVLAGSPMSLEFPQQTRFNLVGGLQVKPEFIALMLALSIYTAAFIAEIVRAGILAVSHGQTEAAHSLGLRPGPTLRLIVIPQALRVIIPPLTSQYLNLTKNSSLAVAIGYPDLVSVGGTILNQTGQAVEIVIIWMAVYLGISLATSLFMNWFNRRVALVER
ncbi:amino acid ABC transporter permease [Propylenella binzhouense]|uniref:Amino acid ABC transporter permease n=1 Tax=Propylenella binzhouense TaxID=2555902 RepID=A0A964T7V4_9HYPH|nr:amino acid ABC transporter permease [Propylenella binzhouense]MYZ50128.1 amino acid ABC transporter permease [Propylenella binzhouense]